MPPCVYARKRKHRPNSLERQETNTQIGHATGQRGVEQESRNKAAFRQTLARAQAVIPGSPDLMAERGVSCELVSAKFPG